MWRSAWVVMCLSVVGCLACKADGRGQGNGAAKKGDAPRTGSEGAAAHTNHGSDLPQAPATAPRDARATPHDAPAAPPDEIVVRPLPPGDPRNDELLHGGDLPEPTDPTRQITAATPNALQRGYEKPVPVAAPNAPYRRADCQTRYAPRPKRDSSPMCFAPGGRFVMGAPPEVDLPAAQPARNVTLSPFFIDQFEVTRAQFARFLNEAKHDLACFEIAGTHTFCDGDAFGSLPWTLDITQDGKLIDFRDAQFTAGKMTFAARRGQERIAMSDITSIAAAAYCAWAGKQLPSHAEWEYAARVEPRTGKLRLYPWGDQFRKGLALTYESDCRHQRGNACEPAVDAHPGDTSAIGVRNLAGNVEEWLRECVSDSIPDCGTCIDPVGPTDCKVGPRRSAKDGRGDLIEHGYASRGGNLYVYNTYSRGYYRPERTVADEDSGFRCMTPAQPTVTSPPATSP